MNEIVLLDKISEYYKDGKHYVRVNLRADSKNITLPQTGENIDGLTANDHIAVGSTITTTDNNMINRGLTDWGEWLL